MSATAQEQLTTVETAKELGLLPEEFEKIKENDLLNDIIFLSDHVAAKEFAYTSAADFPAIYQQAIAMIYPSTFEGFGIPVLEALWSNIPVITSNVSCMPETGGNAACYVSPFDVHAMANAMHEIANNENLRNEMIAKGKIHAQQFTQQKCAEAVMNVYQKLSKIVITSLLI